MLALVAQSTIVNIKKSFYLDIVYQGTLGIRYSILVDLAVAHVTE